MIFVCHYFTEPWFGKVGVTLFFVISGYCTMLGQYQKEIKSLDFIKHKLQKLYPSYFLVLLFCFLCSFVLWPVSCPVLKFLCHALLLQTILPLNCMLEFNSAAWYVATLFWLYVFFIGISRLVKKNEGAFCGVVVLLCFLFQFLNWSPRVNFDKLWFFYFSPFGRLLDFSIGCFFAILYLKLKQRKKEIKLKMATALEAITFSLLLLYFLLDVNLNVGCVLAILFGLNYLVFSFELGHISRFMKNEFFIACSGYSYSFYIVHYVVIKFMLGIWSYLELNRFMPFILYGCVVFFVTIIGSVALKKADGRLKEKLFKA